MVPSRNNTISSFVLLGFSDTPHLVLPLSFFFLAAYVLCLVGNVFIVTLIISQTLLHTPMYALMGNLAIVDILFTSIIIPRALYGLLTGDTSISIHGCFIQLFLFVAVGNMDSFLLAIMAFDRLCAVCFPLRYLIIMGRRTWPFLVACSWVIVCLHATLYTVLTYTQPHCSGIIHHYFCDLPVVVMLSCFGFSELLIKIGSVEGPIVIFSPVLFILLSYILIIRAVLTLQSSQGRWKTFSTCSSHLTMVILFYSTAIFMYFRPASIYSPTYDRVISLVYSVIIPMLNPFIYSLRNKEVKTAVRKTSTYCLSICSKVGPSD